MIGPFFTKPKEEIIKQQGEFYRFVEKEIDDNLGVLKNWYPYIKGPKGPALMWEALRLIHIVGDKWRQALIYKHYDWHKFVDYVEKNRIVDWDWDKIINFLVGKKKGND